MTAEQNGVQVIDRTLDILEYLSHQRKGLGVTEIAAQTGLHKSTAHRLLQALLSRGYVEKDPLLGTYKLGLKLIETVSFYLNSLELQTEARPYLWDLTGKLNLTVHLGVLDGTDVVYIEKLDVFNTVRIYSQIGFRVPAYCSALGKCLLSKLSDKELNVLLQGYRFEKYTDNTLPDLPALKRLMREVRAQGWAMDNEEHQSGHRSVAAPIYDYRGEVIAAISASGPVSLIPDERLPELIATVKKNAVQISQHLGYTP